MGGKKDFVDSIFSLKITLIPSKGLVYFCEMTFIPHIFPFCFSSYSNTLNEIFSFPHSFFFSLLFFSLLYLSLPFHWTKQSESTSNNFSKFLYCFESEQLHLLFTYLLFLICIPTNSLSHLNIIFSLFL